MADKWIIGALQDTEDEINRQLDEYRFDLAGEGLYEFVWNEYCDWYLELSKVDLARGDEASQRGTRPAHWSGVLEDDMLRLAHPFIPFISEELCGSRGAGRQEGAHRIAAAVRGLI
jgi:valyl-tRNA synthetase